MKILAADGQMASHDSGFYEFNDPPRLSAEEQSRVAGLAGQAYHLLCKQPNQVCLVSSPLYLQLFVSSFFSSPVLEFPSLLCRLNLCLTAYPYCPSRSVHPFLISLISPLLITLTSVNEPRRLCRRDPRSGLRHSLILH